MDPLDLTPFESGMSKMVINHLEKLFVTSDASTIMNELEVQHPAAKLLVFAARAQEMEIGDGTNLVRSDAWRVCSRVSTKFFVICRCLPWAASYSGVPRDCSAMDCTLQRSQTGTRRLPSRWACNHHAWPHADCCSHALYADGSTHTCFSRHLRSWRSWSSLAPRTWTFETGQR